MTTLCPKCQHWTPIPADLGAAQSSAPAMPQCEHCGTALPVEGRYGLCNACGRIHRTDYEDCPFKVEGAAVGAQASADAVSNLYSIEAQKRKPKKRSDDYYWQLYFDYRDKVEEPADLPAPPDLGEDPPHPADLAEYTPVSSNGNGNGHSNSNGNGNGHNRNGYSNGNGSPRSAQPGGASRPNGNGYSNGNGNGYGSYGKKPGGQSTRVDLTIAESVPVTLFAEAELSSLSPVVAAAVEVKPTAGNFNEFEYELINDPSRLAEVAELLASEKVIGVDTETTGLDPYTSELLLLQISTLDKVYIVDCRRLVPLALKPLLENPDIIKVAQNAKFEYVMLKQQAGITVNNFFDTMLAEKLLMAGIGREVSLKVIAQKYIGATLDKSVRENFYKLAMSGDAYLAPEQLHYAARDAFIMIPIWQRMLPDLKKHKLMQVAELEFRCVPAVGDLELAGVQIDVVRWRKIISDVGVQRDQAASELSELLAPATMQATMFGVPAINLNSGTQLMEAFATLGVNLPDTMEASLLKFDHPAVAKLLEYRQHEKTLSAFGENVLGLINPKTGRIHPSFQQYGADTGRFSCTRPNVQQIPATSDFRKCFIAAPGYKLVTCDYSQAELRILAELSGDEAFVSAFKSGQDLHTLTASQMFGVPVDQVQKSQRSAAKAINFGLAYGMGPGGLAPRLGVSLDESKALISRYFAAYPGVQRWLDKAAKDSVRLGYSVTPLGRKRFYNLPDESLKRTNEDEWRKQISAIERQGKNSPIQGCNADMTKLALINLRAALRGWDARTVNTVHDEIVVEAREDVAEEVKHLVEKAMIGAGQALLKEVPIMADASIADYWSK